MDAAVLITDARRRSGLSQRELADRAGTSAAAVCLYESGRRVPRADTLTRLVAACGQTLHASLTSPSPAIDVEVNGRRLTAVLELAQHLPRRSSERLDAPVFAELASR